MEMGSIDIGDGGVYQNPNQWLSCIAVISLFPYHLNIDTPNKLIGTYVFQDTKYPI